MTTDTELFINAGLSEQKAAETLKNKNVSAAFKSAIEQCSTYAKIDASLGKLLYHVATKVKDPLNKGSAHFTFLIKYVGEKKLTSELQLNFALDFLKKNTAMPINDAAFSEAAGVGVVVSPEEIENTIEKLIKTHKDELVKQRYSFNVGKILMEARKHLKFADGKIVKSELDMQVLELLGPKTEEDLNSKNKKGKDKKKGDKPAAAKAKVKKTDDADETASLMDQLRGAALKFHKPGENYTTEGYVMTENTMKHMENHLKITGGQVRTRFPPEPNGILHIGHAKAINFNFGYAKANDGVCFLRYDDTNPEKEEEKFFTAILDMVRWLGYEPYQITHASDNFDKLYECAVDLIKKDLCYVCHQPQSEIQGINPKPSPWRNRPIKESLQLFEDMRKGKIDEGTTTLRMKHVMEDGKTDPVAYRIKFTPHHCTGDAWCIYPTYDFTHCLCDSIEHISHSLCTKEFQARRSSYYWLCNAVDMYCPVQWEYGRLNLQYTVCSKRKIQKLIDTGVVRDWDDPRLFTLTALRRRGIPPEAINNFCAKVGVTGNQVLLEPSMLDACVRSILNEKAPRRMCVIDPLEIVIDNFADISKGKEITVDIPNFPSNEAGGHYKSKLSDKIFIERTDFTEEADKSYKRFATNQTVGLRHAGYVLTFVSSETGSDGQVSRIHVTAESVDSAKKPKAFVHWVSSNDSKVCEVRFYSRLFKHKNPEDKSEVPGGYETDCDQNSLVVNSTARVPCAMSNLKLYDRFQFERVGYFCVDKDSTANLSVFNQTIPLKEDSGKN